MALLLSASASLFADPTLVWQQYPEGLSVALTWTKQVEAGSDSVYLIAHVRNDSKNIKQLLNQGYSFAGFSYLGDDGKPVGLQRRLHPNNSIEDEIERNQRLEAILPGETKTTGIEITPDELALIKIHPVICTLRVEDGSTGRGSIIEASPKLTEGP